MPSHTFSYRPGYYISVYTDVTGKESIDAVYSPTGTGYEWIKHCASVTGAKRACTKHYRETKAALIASLDEFTRAYIVAAMWSSTDDKGEPIDRNRDIYDMSLESLREMSDDCAKFQADNAEDLAIAYERYIRREGYKGPALAGHDFWLTRCGHGVGFWDRSELDASEENPDNVGQRLTDACEALGEAYMYVASGEVHCG